MFIYVEGDSKKEQHINIEVSGNVLYLQICLHIDLWCVCVSITYLSLDLDTCKNKLPRQNSTVIRMGAFPEPQRKEFDSEYSR